MGKSEIPFHSCLPNIQTSKCPRVAFALLLVVPFPGRILAFTSSAFPLSLSSLQPHHRINIPLLPPPSFDISSPSSSSLSLVGSDFNISTSAFSRCFVCYCCKLPFASSPRLPSLLSTAALSPAPHNLEVLELSALHTDGLANGILLPHQVCYPAARSYELEGVCASSSKKLQLTPLQHLARS